MSARFVMELGLTNAIIGMDKAANSALKGRVCAANDSDKSTHPVVQRDFQ
ncbi:hypothetical protein CCP2SC5_220036 [Azospirillaceae bacterium]